MDEGLISDYVHLTLRQVRAVQRGLTDQKNQATHPLLERFEGVETWDKSTIRQVLRQRRREVTSEERLQAGRMIAHRLYDEAHYLMKNAIRLALYLSSTHELPTRYVARRAWGQSQHICVPGWSQQKKNYRFYELYANSRLVKGPQGIREPAERKPVDIREIDLFVLPGLAFDCTGGRLGYGGGNYDRLLADARKNAIKIAFAYDWQVVSQPLPLEAHDIRVDWIVTPYRMIDCRNLSKKDKQ